MKKILVTGANGFIGSHTVVDLVQHGYEVIGVDNFSRSNATMQAGIESILQRKLKMYKVDLCNFDDTHAIFTEHPDIVGIIHFAAYKAVGESVEEPLLYYDNNLVSLMNLLKCVQEFETPHFVFSSSCTVYGNPDAIPVTEDTPLKPAESPYGETKVMGEMMLRQVSRSTPFQTILLRYFNPVGAHPSIHIGELPIGRPMNLVPAITQTAIGKIPDMKVHGNDYPTRDGSCIRDYIHVCDIARAHTLALDYQLAGKQASAVEVFNLGTGEGVSVLEAIHAFEKVSGLSLPYSIGPRREGDVVAIYANNDKAKSQLGWQPQFNLEDMMRTAWQWEQKLFREENLLQNQHPELN